MPVREHLFRSARLQRGHHRLSADRTLVQVEWVEDAERFDLRSTGLVATAVADVDVPANACPMQAGQVWEMAALDTDGPTRLQVLPVRLVEIRPGENRFRRWYTWQFLIVRRPARDPYRLFPRPQKLQGPGEIREDAGDILGDLKDLLSSEIADGAVVRFNTEGGFDLQRA